MFDIPEVPMMDIESQEQLLAGIGLRRVPTLADVLRLCAQHGEQAVVALKFFVENLSTYPEYRASTCDPFLWCTVPSCTEETDPSTELKCPLDCFVRPSRLFSTLCRDVADAVGDSAEVLGIRTVPTGEQFVRLLETAPPTTSAAVKAMLEVLGSQCLWPSSWVHGMLDVIRTCDLSLFMTITHDSGS